MRVEFSFEHIVDGAATILENVIVDQDRIFIHFLDHGLKSFEVDARTKSLSKWYPFRKAFILSILLRTEHGRNTSFG